MPLLGRAALSRWGMLLAIAAISIWRAGDPEEVDPYWEARAGLEWLHSGNLTPLDTWGYGYTGTLTFYPNSPLWNVVLGIAWQALGAWGLFLAGLIAVGVPLWWLARLTVRIAGSNTASLLAFLACAGYGFSAITPRATFLASGLLLGALLWQARFADRAALGGNRTAPVLGGTFLFSAGANWLHTSWGLFALLSGGIWAALWLADKRLPPRQRMALALSSVIGFTAGIAAGPYHLGVYARMIAVSKTMSGTSEWDRLWDPGRDILLILFCALLTISGAALHQLWLRTGRPLTADRRLLLGHLLVVLALLTLSLVAIRFVVVAAVFTAPLLAEILRRLRPSVLVVLDTTSVVLLTLLLSLLVPPALARHAAPLGENIIRQLPHACHLFSAPGIAGSALLLRPDVKVWRDGRGDMWGRERIATFTAIWERGTQLPVGTTCAVLPKDTPRLSAGLTALAWHATPFLGGILWTPPTNEVKSP